MRLKKIYLTRFFAAQVRVGLLLALSHPFAASAESPAVKDIAKEAVKSNPVTYVTTPFSTQSQCTLSLAPTKALIIGGIKVKALKPLSAKEKLQGQVDQLKSYVQSQGGQVVLGEVIRAVTESRDNPEPYVMAQRFEIELPILADVDTILEQVLKLGMNIYGKNPQLDSSSSSPQILVFYRIENFSRAVTDGVMKCAITSLRSWCEASGKASDICSMNERELAGKLGVSYYYLQTENRLYDNYYPQALTISKDTPVPVNGDLGGSSPLEVRGTVTIQFEQQVAQPVNSANPPPEFSKRHGRYRE